MDEIPTVRVRAETLEELQRVHDPADGFPLGSAARFYAWVFLTPGLPLLVVGLHVLVGVGGAWLAGVSGPGFGDDAAVGLTMSGIGVGMVVMYRFLRMSTRHAQRPDWELVWGRRSPGWERNVAGVWHGGLRITRGGREVTRQVTVDGADSLLLDEEGRVAALRSNTDPGYVVALTLVSLENMWSLTPGDLRRGKRPAQEHHAPLSRAPRVRPEHLGGYWRALALQGALGVLLGVGAVFLHPAPITAYLLLAFLVATAVAAWPFEPALALRRLVARRSGRLDLRDAAGAGLPLNALERAELSDDAEIDLEAPALRRAGRPLEAPPGAALRLERAEGGAWSLALAEHEPVTLDPPHPRMWPALLWGLWTLCVHQGWDLHTPFGRFDAEALSAPPRRRFERLRQWLSGASSAAPLPDAAPADEGVDAPRQPELDWLRAASLVAAFGLVTLPVAVYAAWRRRRLARLPRRPHVADGHLVAGDRRVALDDLLWVTALPVHAGPPIALTRSGAFALRGLERYADRVAFGRELLTTLDLLEEDVEPDVEAPARPPRPTDPGVPPVPTFWLPYLGLSLLAGGWIALVALGPPSYGGWLPWATAAALGAGVAACLAHWLPAGTKMPTTPVAVLLAYPLYVIGLLVMWGVG